MKRSLLWGAVALMTVLVAACTQPPAGGGGGPTAPDTISGLGQYDYRVTEPGQPDFEGGNPAAFSLSRTDDVYAGTVQSENSGPGNNVELTVSGHAIVSLYANDVNLGPGVGPEILTSDVVASTVTDAVQCPGADALQLSIGGSYTVDGDPSDLVADRVTWTICDPAAAAWFG